METEFSIFSQTLERKNLWENFYSETPSFISSSEVAEMKEVLHSIRRTIQLPNVKKELLKNHPRLLKGKESEGGVFLSLDFHKTPSGPKLIEINTNAGGAFLQLMLMSAQIRCCKAVDIALPSIEEIERLKNKFLSIFIEEWKTAHRSGLPQLIAIVDENPKDQFLYPEFIFFRDLFRSQGIDSEILSPEQIQMKDGKLYYKKRQIDLIYNRLTDFHLTERTNLDIYTAWREDEVVLTPNPLDYDLYAKKSNLTILSNDEFLKTAGASDSDLKVLQRAIPKSDIVNTEKSDDIWNKRKNFFFKPREGFGSKAAYYGGKLTKGKFEEILKGNYIYQEFVPPSIRATSISGTQVEMKMDVRAYIYKDEILLLASRLYQGQTTNFRTPGGGFSPLYVIPDL
ncbi:circularly permuted ATPgrasp domain protein [Leptospira broomii serovar Hurstbridge str. 5399]|uniref:Circularly permuted ATPgrasp domain protein n=1 Tax=Leptospira broomii serovar Hurstbridge str. 5399 TaxID=1049789 RepID=T0GBH8_9LEPT|nr:circularly permuted ATPgrasp domain protein [Leptospira broomii]EQA44159.1 circularly permuted ATPgrasp domain protein [Leptospira broomii serovar Hurstbridge str. 5399]